MRTNVWLLFGWISFPFAMDAFAADPLDTWRVRNPLPHANNLRAITYGNGMYVAVGDAGIILTSTDDGSGWAVRDSGITNTAIDLTGVAFGNNKFVAVSQSSPTNVLTSTNGINWSQNAIAFGGSAFRGIAFGNGRFVITGTRGSTNLLMSSADGVSWTQHATPSNAPTSGTIIAVTYAQSLFAAVGGSGGTGYVFTSPDGITWTTRRTNVTEQLSAVAGGNGFVAMGPFSTITRSPDGITWTDTAQASARFRQGITYGNNTFVMVDQITGGNESGYIYTSPDGLSWSIRFTGLSLSAVTYGSSNFVVVGTPNLAQFGTVAAIYTSANGTNWLPQFSSVKFSDDTRRNFYTAAFGNGQFVLAGDSSFYGGFGVSSSNLVNWAGIFGGITPEPLNGVAYSSNLFVIVGGSNNQYIATSTNGSVWTAQYAPSGGGLNGITRGGATFVAVGRDTTNGGQVFTSTDATNWVDQAPGLAQELSGVAFGNNLFVAVGNAGLAARSADGATWTSQTLTVSNNLRAVAFGNNQFVAVGDSGRIFTSTDGTSWTSRSSGTVVGLNGVAWFNGRFVVVGKGGIALVSTNGVSWTKQEMPTDYDLRAITTTSNLILVAGESGVVFTSADGSVWAPRDVAGSYAKGEFFDAVVVGNAIYANSEGPLNYSQGGRTWFGLGYVGSSRVDLQACKLEYSIVSPK